MRILIAPDHCRVCGEAVDGSDHFCPRCGHSTWSRPWWRYVLPTVAVVAVLLWQFAPPPVQQAVADFREALGL